VRPAKVSRAEAEAIMAAMRARGIAHPKPVPVLKPRWKLKRGPAPKRKTALRMHSDATRERIKAWPGLKLAVFERDGGICYWCGKFCPIEDGTVEHLVPRVHTLSDDETGIGWIHHRGFPMSCHGAKSSAGFQGQVTGLKVNAVLYGAKVDLNPTRVPGQPMREWYREFRDNLWRALQDVQRRINRGEIPSPLTRERPNG
jgi:5-methylcytosine-specific restriction endonuclease McrA